MSDKIEKDKVVSLCKWKNETLEIFNRYRFVEIFHSNQDNCSV